MIEFIVGVVLLLGLFGPVVVIAVIIIRSEIRAVRVFQEELGKQLRRLDERDKRDRY